PVARWTLMAFSSSSFRNLLAEGIPIASANSLSSVAYQYPLSNWVNVIDVDSFLFDFKRALQRGCASARMASSRLAWSRDSTGCPRLALSPVDGSGVVRLRVTKFDRTSGQ